MNLKISVLAHRAPWGRPEEAEECYCFTDQPQYITNYIFNSIYTEPVFKFLFMLFTKAPEPFYYKWKTERDLNN